MVPLDLMDWHCAQIIGPPLLLKDDVDPLDLQHPIVMGTLLECRVKPVDNLDSKLLP